MNHKYTILFLLFWCLLCGSFHSNAQLDSLRKVFANSAHDSTRVLALGRIGRYFESVNFDSALYYYNQALAHSRKPSMKQYPEYEGSLSENIGFAYIYGQGNTKEGIDWMKKGLKIHQASSNQKEALKTAYNIAFILSKVEAFDSAMIYYQYVIEQNEDAELQVRLHESYNNLGLLYYYQAKYEKASYYLLEGIKLKEKLGETKEIHHSYMNVGLVFQELDECERAKKYFQKANKAFTSLNSKYGIAVSIENYAKCLLVQDSLDMATVKYKEAFTLYKSIENQNGIAKYYQNMSIISLKRNQYQEAHDYLLLSEKEFPEKASRTLKMSIYNNIATTKLLLLDSNSAGSSLNERALLIGAADYASKAWTYAEELGDQNDLLEAATTLATAYERLNDLPKALFYAKEQARLSEELNAKAKTASIAEMMTKYETEQVESENALLKQQKIANNAQLKQQQQFTVAGITVAGLLAILALVVYRSREQVKTAQAITEKSLEEKGLLLKEIHHRVKNNLQIVSSLLSLQTHQTEDEAVLSAMSEGQNRVQAMALIHQGLYQNENLDKIHFQDYAQQLLGQLASIYPNGNKVQKEVLASDVRLDIDTAVPLGLILNELITNAFKYAFKDIEHGSLQIELSQRTDNEYALTVSDNGKGLPEDFNLKKARSIGLKLIKGLSKQLYGNFDYQYQDGAKFTVTFKDTELRKQLA